VFPHRALFFSRFCYGRRMPPPPAAIFDDEKNPTLDELVAAYEKSPDSYTQRISFNLPASKGARSTGRVLGPTREMPLDEDELWRECAERLGGPGEVLVRLRARGGGTGQITVLVDVSEAIYRALSAAMPVPVPVSVPSSTTQQHVPPPPPAPVPVQQPYQVQAATDVMSLLLASMQNSQQTMMEMIRELRAPRADPAVEALRAENVRLQRTLDGALAAPSTREREERAEWLALAGKAAEGGSGYAEAAVRLLAGPLEKFADVFGRTADARIEVDKINAEARILEAANRASPEAGDVPVPTAPST